MSRRNEYTKTSRNRTYDRNYGAIMNDLFIGLLVANGMAVLTGLIGVYIGFLFSVFVLLFSCVFIGMFSMMYSLRLSTLFIFTAMLGIAVSYSVWEYEVLVSGETMYGISVNMAPEYPDASAFVFTNATVRREYMGKIKSCSKTGTGQITCRFTCVVPLVPYDWTIDQTVPAWAVCTESVDDTDVIKNEPCSFPDDFKIAVATVYDVSEGAIKKACAKYGLTTNSNAPVLRLAYSLKEEINKAFSMLKWFVIGFNLVWIVIFLILAFTVSPTVD